MAALVIVAIVVVVVLASSGAGPAPADLPPPPHRAHRYETIFTEGSAITTDPAGQIAQLHALGVDRVRVSFTWGAIAPHPTSRRMPANLNAADPAAYPASAWAPYDTIARELKAHHMGLDLVLAPPPPLWASGRGAPAPTATHPYWKPSAREFEQFVEAVGKRYSGHYTPPGASSPLPRESFWSIWNEPNIGVMLAPQSVNGPTIESSPTQYRKLADAAWTALQKTGHGHDTTLIGELAPAGSTLHGAPGNFSAMAPLRFLRVLYCVGTDFKALSGAAARLRGCPATTAGTKGFAAANPVLFHATDFADHPYPQGLPPNVATPNEPDYAELAELPKLFSTLDRLQRVYGSHRRYDVYDTEYGYQTSPPDTQSGTVTPALAAKYLNWSEYLMWRMPRMLSYNQYLLADPAPPHPGKPYLAFASGLVTYSGQPKPGLYAFRMPIWLPVSRTTAHHPLEVWGCVRPAKTIAAARRSPAQIQWRPASAGAWRTVATVSTRSRYGYFDVRVIFPGSGTVRVRWAPPHGPAIVSRTSPITIG